MLPLDVPFVPGGKYPEFLSACAESLASVHFSLHDPNVADARQIMTRPGMEEIISGLERLGNVARYVLMNARLHAPGRYFDHSGLDATARRLETLLDRARLDGVIFADPYFLQALSDTHPNISSRLEAVPSVNTLLDSAGKVFSILDLIGKTAFRMPSRIVLDRSLNRDLEGLERVSNRLRAAFPGMKLHLIANEGCLFQCPFKPAHDAHVALVNEGLCAEMTFAMNRDLGCIRCLLTDPGSMPASPFIRPEDVALYAPHIDGIKLCGRNKGTAFLKRVVRAYLTDEYRGNLLDLMDAMGDLSDRIVIPNHELPAGFAAKVTACDKNCKECGWCAALMNKIATRTDPGLSRLDSAGRENENL